jgi:hypothetical protein
MARPAKRYPIAYLIGDHESAHITPAEVEQWTKEITSWIRATQTRVDDPRQKAEEVVHAAIHGTKLNGEAWLGIEKFSLTRRIAQLCGWNIETKIGKDGNVSKRKNLDAKSPAVQRAKTNTRINQSVADEFTLEQLYTKREEFKDILYSQYPHLNNPVYAIKVNALAEAEVRLSSLSESFMSARGKDLESYTKVQNELRKSINELMEMLSIHPKQLMRTVDETERGDVGTLMVKWEDYGKIAEEYEVIDAIQELIISVRQANQLRLDGSPQLADYLLAHRTGCQGHNFTCGECGTVYELYAGFTKEELEKAAEQAYEKFGYGLKRIDTHLVPATAGEVADEVADGDR